MSSRSFLTALFIAILLVTTNSQIRVYSQTADELKGNLDNLSAQIKALDAEIKAYNTKISQTQGQAKTLKQALAALELRRNALNKDIAYTKLKIQQAEENISFTQNKIKSTEGTLERNKAALAETLRSAVHNEQSVPPILSMLAPGAHLSDTIDILERNSNVSEAINEKVAALIDTKTTLAVQKASYEQHKNELVSLNQTLSGQKQIVDQTSKDKNDLLAQTKNQESAYQKLLADRQNKKNQLEAEMSDIEAKLTSVVDKSSLPKNGKGVLLYPVNNVVITQYFGNTPFSTANPQVYNGSGHNGIDLGVKVGTQVYSAQSGTVVGTGNTDLGCNGVSYGKWILIRHNNGLSTLYGHLSVIQVSAGETVTAHQPIALSGNTGYSTGPHVHFTVYASDVVQITNYRSKVCGTNMVMPIAPRSGYLNPLSYL